MTTHPKYRNRDTASFVEDDVIVRRLQGVPKMAALTRLERLRAAISLNDLRIPRGNRLELLSGNRAGQHSIRINDQWRICFEWSEAGREAFNIEIVDYH